MQINHLDYFKIQEHVTKGDKELLFARSVHASAPGGMVELWRICDSLGRGWRLFPVEGSSPIVGVTRDHRR